jgi:hypothetical protein
MLRFFRYRKKVKFPQYRTQFLCIVLVFNFIRLYIIFIKNSDHAQSSQFG